MPVIVPEEVAKKALAQYDTNKDGFLDATELENCPALKSALKTLDKNKDGKLSADEIAERLSGFQASNVGMIGVPCRLTLDNEPLEGAAVTLVPEKFLGPEIEPASGVSDATGSVSLRVKDHPVPGARWGYYRIEVSKKNAAGTEMLPARYNAKTTLGAEVSPDMRRGLVLHLSSS
jgi:hypothetical protein